MDKPDENDQMEKIIRDVLDKIMEKKEFLVGIGTKIKEEWSFPLCRQRPGEYALSISVSKESGLQVKHVASYR